MALSALVKSHFMNLYHMVLADAMVKPQELLKIYEIGLRHGVTEEEFNQLVLSHSIDFTAPETLEQKVAIFADNIPAIQPTI